MKLVIGLGNPEDKFKNNRHNVGQRFVREFGKQQVEYEALAQAKWLETNAFMNESGKFVAEKARMLKLVPQDLVIVHDDLDIPIGKFKIDFGVGPKVHNGINSIEEALGTKNFWRVRIGVDHRDPNDRIQGDVYVLQDFTKEEGEILKSLFPTIWQELEVKL